MLHIRKYATNFNIVALIVFLALGVQSLLTAHAAEKPKPATDATKAANSALYKQLPFADKQAYQHIRSVQSYRRYISD
jgi:alkyl sulfatase BDS1-like metallo-beta-lactamase superfamily hydrolase